MDLLLERCLPTTLSGSENFGETWFRETLGSCQLCGTSGELIMHAWVDLCPACLGLGACVRMFIRQPSGVGQDAVADRGDGQETVGGNLALVNVATPNTSN